MKPDPVAGCQVGEDATSDSVIVFSPFLWQKVGCEVEVLRPCKVQGGSCG